MPKSLTTSSKKPSRKKPAPKKASASASRATAAKIDKPRAPSRQMRPRGLKRLNYRRWRRDRKEHIAQQVRLPNVLQITKMTAELLWKYKALFIGIVLIYGVLNLILVKGFAGATNVTSLKSELNQVFTGSLGHLASGLTVFVVLIGSSGAGSSASSSAYQVLLVLLASLAIIWTLRQVLAGSRPRIRDAYYRGMYPLIPFLLVLVVIAAQFIPLVIGSAVYTAVVTNGIAVSSLSKAVWLIIFIILALWSLYMVTASLFGLYVATLPDMPPLTALRSARELVLYRRWTVLLKVLFLPIMLFVVGMVIVLPVIAIAAPLAQWVFFVLSLVGLAAAHTYMYTLYRELLREKESGAAQ